MTELWFALVVWLLMQRVWFEVTYSGKKREFAIYGGRIWTD